MLATVQKPIQRWESNRREVERLAYAILDAHSHFHRRADRFEFLFREDVLVVRGSVPSFYLKQVLQSALHDLDGVDRVDNQVEVVSSDGLSSLGDKAE